MSLQFFFQQLPEVKPMIVRIIEPDNDASMIARVIINSIGLAGVLMLGAILLGIALGGLFIGFRLFRPQNHFNGDSPDEAHLRLNSLSHS